MKVLSINISLPKSVKDNGKTVSTGIFKEPITGSVSVGKRNIVGDQQADLNFHGGVCKAVYAYPHEHYAHWKRELHRTDMPYGQFGENLTLQGLDEESVYVGDLLHVGTAVFEVTQPRVPCFKLGIRMGGLSDFPRTFLKSGLIGFYLRVAQEGTITAGDTIEHVRVDPHSISIKEIHHLMHFDKRNIEDAKKALRIDALPPGWCRGFEKRLAAAGVAYVAREHPLDSECCVSL